MSHPARPGERVEGVDQIDLGLGYGCGAESGAQEGDVLAFFDSGLGGVGCDGRDGEWHFGEAGLGDDSALGACAGDGDGRGELVDGDAVDGEVVEVGLEVFEVEGEVEDVGIGDGGGLGVCRFGEASEGETCKSGGSEREHLASAAER